MVIHTLYLRYPFDKFTVLLNYLIWSCIQSRVLFTDHKCPKCGITVPKIQEKDVSANTHALNAQQATRGQVKSNEKESIKSNNAESTSSPTKTEQVETVPAKRYAISSVSLSYSIITHV